MRRVHTIGLDIAKEVFQVHGVDGKEKVCLRKKLKRSEVAPFFAELPRSTIGIEACGSAHHWARVLVRLGHTVKLIPTQYVKAYVKVQKSDARDAEAICEAVRRPAMRFVPIKTKKQQSVLFLHTAREALLRQKIALSNALRGFFSEFGIVRSTGKAGLREIVSSVIGQVAKVVPKDAHAIFKLLAEELEGLRKRIATCEKLINESNRRDPRCERIAAIPGVGALTASAVVGLIGDARRFQSARHFSAWIGLVPREFSSGGKTSKGRITRAGNSYLRKLLFIAAKAAVRFGKGARSPEALLRWGERLAKRKPFRVVIIALANKIARIAWAMLRKNQEFQPSPIHLG